jgi:hypothetical protein
MGTHGGAHPALNILDLLTRFHECTLKALKFRADLFLGERPVGNVERRLSQSENLCVGDSARHWNSPVDTFAGWLALRHAAR